MIKSFVYLSSLLAVGAVCFSCSNNEEIVRNVEPPSQKIWTASLKATGKDIGGLDETETSTRAVFYGGNNGHRFYFIWDNGDKVDVYKGETKLGTLTPSKYGEESTILTGSLSGDISLGDELNLYMPARAYDYTGQDASLAKLSLEKAFQYSTTTVEEAKSAGSSLTLNATTLTHAQSYWWLRLTDENGDRLHPTRLQIYGTSGKMVKTKAIDGTTTYFTEEEPMDITIAKSDDNGEYPGEAFLAIRNEKGSADTYKFKAWVGEDVYVGPYDRQLNYDFAYGVMNNVKRQMRKTTAVSTLAVADIPSRVFTGSAYEPAVTVTDGEDALTLNTDYSVSYADNTNVGTATVTVKGLADAGAVAETKYLGTQDKTFNIVKATPVIEMDASTMTLVNNTDASQNTQTRTVTRVFIDNNGNGTWDDGTDYDITALCTVTYSTDDDAVATVNATTGQVTAAGPTTCTITATVAGADNWTSKTATYTVNVEQEVNGGNSVNPWTSGGEPEDDKIYVE